MNKQHRAFRNNLYALRLLWKICPRQVIHKALMRLLGYCEWLFYSAFFMRYVVHALETKQEFSALMTFLMITVTVFAAISLGNVEYDYAEHNDCCYNRSFLSHDGHGWYFICVSFFPPQFLFS